jgi:hypothetical protein
MKFNMKNVTKTLPGLAVKTGGAIASSMAVNAIPFGDDKTKNGIIFAVGAILSGTKGTLGQLGEGMAIGAGMKLASSFGIAGAQTFAPFDEFAAIQGASVMEMGEYDNDYND